MQLVRVDSNDPGGTQEQVLNDLNPPAPNWTHPLAKGVPNAIDVEFTGSALKFGSVTWGNPPNPLGTFRFQPTGNTTPLKPAPVLFNLAGNRIRLYFGGDGLRPGTYEFELYGKAEPNSANQAITSTNGDDLSGEIAGPWPTGGTAGPGTDFGPIKLEIH
jgi:hypothetical protein